MDAKEESELEKGVVQEDLQEPPPGTVEKEGTPCWKCSGTGFKTIKKQKRECNVCHGSGKIISEVRKKLYLQPGRVMEERRWPENSVIPGPKAAGPQDDPLLSPKSGEALCNLCGHWKIFQRLGGHRFSMDDVVTAWCASSFIQQQKWNELPSLPYLDMGCGLGSVLMFVSWRFQNTKSVGIEAQKISYELAKRSLLYNIGKSDRIQVINGDLRDFTVLPEDQKFKIITGTPPYFKSGEAALPSKIDQKACLFEFRGGVEEYCRSASHYLADDGHFFVVESYLCRQRIDVGAECYGLKIVERWDVIPKEGKPPLICVAHLRKRVTTEEHAEVDSHGKENYSLHVITVRNKDDQYTPQYDRILQDMGFPPQRNVGALPHD